jgi:hypothetical protein
VLLKPVQVRASSGPTLTQNCFRSSVCRPPSGAPSPRRMSGVARMEDLLGKLVQFGNMDGDFAALTVVGIVDDVQDYGVSAPAHCRRFTPPIGKVRGPLPSSKS